jgi:hypothetical protein
MHAHSTAQADSRPGRRDVESPAVSPAETVSAQLPVLGLTIPTPAAGYAVVGAASDPAEVEAEQTAGLVVQLLRRRHERPNRAAEERSRPAAAGVAGLARLHLMARTGERGGSLDADGQARIDRLRGQGRPLPAPVRRLMESVFDADLGSVRVHTGGEAAALNERLSSRAFTVGDDMVFANGMPDVQQESGRHLLAHELTHVLQHGGTSAIGPVRRSFPDLTPASGPDGNDVPRASSAALRVGPTVRRLMNVSAFQALTPALFLEPRKSIKVIDDRLTDYLGSTGAARTGASNALIAACTAYITSGGRNAARVAVVTNLRQAALDEQPLLTALGAANADLLEDLMQRGGGAGNLLQLTHLATRATPAHASLLPALISAVGGAAGLADLQALLNALNPITQVTYLTALIAEAGLPNLALLAPLLVTCQANVKDLIFLIPRAGGGNPAPLTRLTTLLGAPVVGSALQSYNGHAEKLFPMALLANGVEATFTRLSDEARHFHRNVAPGQAGGLHLDCPRVSFDAALPAPPPPAPPFTNARYTIRWGHFFQRHVRENFRFQEIKAINAFWPVGWGNPQMKAAVDAWLDASAAAGVYMGGPNPVTDRPAPSNFALNAAPPINANVRGGVFSQPVPPALPAIEQFFPLSAQVAVGIVDFTAAELRAIETAVT